MMAQDKVQLRREEVVGNDIVLEDIYPKTKTNSIADSTKGVPLDQTLSMIINMINNKLSRVVNSVNGRTGVVVLDASDVGLSNVDNVSFGDIKRWVIEYLGDIFHSKQLILAEHLSQIYTITRTNDKAYADRPFYCEMGAEDASDYIAYIGYIWWDEEHEKLQENHLQIKVVGYTDRSLIYNMKVGDRVFSNGGLAVNIWKGEDALKVMNNVISQTGYTAEELGESGLYIDKTKIVPDVYFFDGVYGTITDDGEYKHNQNALVYWSDDPNDTVVGDLPIIQIYVNDEVVSNRASTGGTVETLHTEQNMKVGDIIITNFAFDSYFDADTETTINATYPKILDSLTCRQPAIGRVESVADTSTNTPYVVKFHTIKPNVSRGLKLVDTNTTTGSPTDTAIELDLMSMWRPKMNDDTIIFAPTLKPVNISGINAFEQYPTTSRYPDHNTEKNICTVYPTGKSNNILTETDGKIKSNSTFILPNFSLCVIPGQAFLYETSQRPITNWDVSSTIDSEVSPFTDISGWCMMCINLEKMMWGGTGTPSSNHVNARNISGLRINNDDSTLSESWFGYSDQSTGVGISSHSGGLSVNVGDFLCIGSAEEINNDTPAAKNDFYKEGKVNVRIDKYKGLYSSGENKLGINLANGYIYQPSTTGSRTTTWLDGGLKFIPDNDQTPGQGPLAVNTGMGSSGLGIRNNYLVGTEGIQYGYRKRDIKEDNVLVVQPYSLSEKILTNETPNGVNLDNGIVDVKVNILEEDIVSRMPINYPSNKIWDDFSSMHRDYETNPESFNDYTVYIAGGKRYVFWYEGGTQGRFSDFIVYYSDETEYNLVMQSISSGVIDPAITWPLDLELLSRQCHVLVTPKDPSTNPSEYNVRVSIYQFATTDTRLPDINHDGTVTSTDASLVLELYSRSQSATAIYVNADESEFFTDETLTTHVTPELGKNYIAANFYREIPNYRDPSGEPYRYNMRYIGTTNASDNLIIKRFPVANPGSADEVLLTFDDLINADALRDGVVDSTDATCILNFYSKLQTGSYVGLTLEEAWRHYMRKRLGINVEPGNGSVHTILEYTFTKGTQIRYNDLMGLTSNVDAYGSEDVSAGMIVGNSRLNSLSVKIADKSSGFESFDNTKFGGLRFGTEGYLGVRVNDNNNFSAWNPLKNNILHYDDMTTGSRGIRIYENNVLGVQLSLDGKLDNGELKIDENGCLRLSQALNPNIENLTISGKDSSGNDRSVSYNGDAEIIIQLGDGLIFEE
jgi:hypothetical protein